MVVARRYGVRGRVQGVGFRYFTQQAADAEGIHGWVRNTGDGHVVIEAEGEFEALMRFETRVRQGPPGARADAVDVDEMIPTGRATGFAVRG